MKTIKTILAAVMLLVAANAGARETMNAPDKKATFGIKAGLNISNLGSTDGKEFDNTKSKTGFHAGVTLDYAFTPKWYLLTGLEYTSKGVKIDLGGKHYDQDMRAAYVQLPLCAGFKLQVSDAVAILFNFGPYFAYGLHGELKTGTSHKEDTFSDTALKRFDWGLNFGATAEWRKLCFGLGGDVGMVNVMQKNNMKAETRNMTISLGYKF